jgi:hypothetical protein
MRSRGRCSGSGRRAGLRRDAAHFDLGLGRCHLRRHFRLRGIFFHIRKRKLELLQDGAPLSVNGGTFTKAELLERIGLKEASHLARLLITGIGWRWGIVSSIF